MQIIGAGVGIRVRAAVKQSSEIRFSLYSLREVNFSLATQSPRKILSEKWDAHDTSQPIISSFSIVSMLQR